MDISDEIKNEKFALVSPQEYAAKLKEMFFNNVALWYERIIPASKADELMKVTNGDFSEIWHDHCAVCFKTIDKHTTEKVYLSEDEFDWLCENCYNELQSKK